MVKDCTSNRGLIPKIYKELKKLDTNKPNDPTEKWGTELNRILNRVILNSQEALKEMFNILSHQGNINQDYPKIG